MVTVFLHPAILQIWMHKFKFKQRFSFFTHFHKRIWIVCEAKHFICIFIFPLEWLKAANVSDYHLASDSDSLHRFKTSASKTCISRTIGDSKIVHFKLRIWSSNLRSCKVKFANFEMKPNIDDLLPENIVVESKIISFAYTVNVNKLVKLSIENSYKTASIATSLVTYFWLVNGQTSNNFLWKASLHEGLCITQITG